MLPRILKYRRRGGCDGKNDDNNLAGDAFGIGSQCGRDRRGKHNIQNQEHENHHFVLLFLTHKCSEGIHCKLNLNKGLLLLYDIILLGNILKLIRLELKSLGVFFLNLYDRQ
jgi:hypothetical protein